MGGMTDLVCNSIQSFNDGSKLDGTVGGINGSKRLPDHCTAFQAYVSAIRAAEENMNVPPADITSDDKVRDRG